MIPLSKSPNPPTENAQLRFCTFTAHVRLEEKEQRSISQREVAENTGSARNTMMNFLHADTDRIDLPKVQKVAAYYGVSPIDLLFWDVNED